MNAIFDVVQGGLGNSIQDAGRPGFRQQGVPCSGWLDARLAQCANALLDNPLHAAVLELRAMGPKLLLAQGVARVALCGEAQAKLVRASGPTQDLHPWCAVSMQAGDALQVGVISDGCAYLACSGGWDASVHMGSRATYARVGLGGLQGRTLQDGDQLHTLAHADHGPASMRAAAWTYAEGPIRVMLGPQADHFNADAIAALTASEWQTTAAQDRMGVRLSGPRLAHRDAAAADIVSDGIAPGAIQVPADGQPIVLLADCQTMGGYPKIATVISADLPRLAHMPAGAVCRFSVVDGVQAQAALRERVADWQTWLASRRAYAEPGWIDESALAQCNLISGVINAQQPEAFHS